MWEFILEYWIELLFTGIVAAVSLMFKHYFSLIKKEFKKEREEFQKVLRKETDDKIAAIKEANKQEIDALVNETQYLKRGLLSVQGKLFREECYKLLEEGHTITLDEFEQLEDDHDAYNALGGNHNGDMLFGLVTIKFEENLKG